jgi:hypothetical protein
MNFYQYIANQPLLTLLVLLMGIDDESINDSDKNIISGYSEIPSDCEMTKMRTKKIILSRYDDQINVKKIDDNLRKRDISPTNKYYKSILKKNKPSIILPYYKDIDYE